MRNLVGAIGLYCDLLSIPHVLRPEHRHYADELRLLGQRAAALMERLIDWDRHPDLPAACSNGSDRRGSAASNLPDRPRYRPEGLRPMVERCAGLLRGVAEGCAVEFTYGEASTVPVGVAAELSIQSQPGAGTRVLVEWPVAQFERRPDDNTAPPRSHNERLRRA